MLVADLLDMMLDDALEDAREPSLTGRSGALAFEGSRRAVAECRAALVGDGMAERLGSLLRDARRASARAVSTQAPDQWFWFAREVQLDAFADMVSVLLLQRRMPTIVPPTRGAAIAVARIAGMLPQH